MSSYIVFLAALLTWSAAASTSPTNNTPPLLFRPGSGAFLHPRPQYAQAADSTSSPSGKATPNSSRALRRSNDGPAAAEASLSRAHQEVNAVSLY